MLLKRFANQAIPFHVAVIQLTRYLHRAKLRRDHEDWIRRFISGVSLSHIAQQAGTNCTAVKRVIDTGLLAMRRSDRNGEWFEGDTPPPLDLDGVDPNAIIISKTRQANICVQCGDQFFPQRKATKYCSGHCRRQVLKKYHQKVYEKRREDQARLEYLEEVVGGTSTDTETVSPSLR